MTTRKSIYSDADYASFDSNFSSMKLNLIDSKGGIALAPIFPEFIGKKPKAGEKVYNYEAKIGVIINNAQALTLRDGIGHLKKDPSLKSIGIKMTLYTGTKAISVFAPGAIELSKKKFDSYVLRIVNSVEEGDTQKIYHVFQKSEIDMGKDTFEVDTGLNLFIEFLNKIVENSFGVAMHANKRSSNNSSSGNYRSSSRSVVEERESEDDELPPASSRRIQMMESDFEE